jgi:hypothetical protein
VTAYEVWVGEKPIVAFRYPPMDKVEVRENEFKVAPGCIAELGKNNGASPFVWDREQAAHFVAIRIAGARVKPIER